MAETIVVVDTSILIDYYRKTDKANSVWIYLVREGYKFAISAVTKYEIYSGATATQLGFWNEILKVISVIPFDEDSVDVAVSINRDLKRKKNKLRSQIFSLLHLQFLINYHLPLLIESISGG